MVKTIKGKSAAVVMTSMAKAIMSLKGPRPKNRRHKRMKKQGKLSLAIGATSKVMEDFAPKETLGTLSSCPHCGAPIYGLHHVEKGRRPTLQFSCNCRKYLKRFLEAKLQKYLSLEPLLSSEAPDFGTLSEDQQEEDKESTPSAEHIPH